MLTQAQASLRTLRSTQRPIYRLHSDILVMVFEYLKTSSSDNAADVISMVAIASVNKYWREVALAHQQLWNSIVLNPWVVPKGLAPLHLSRSGNLPLNIYITCADEEKMEWSEGLLRDISPRIQSLNCDPFEGYLQNIFCHPTPNLRSLTLALWLYDDAEQLLFAGHTPALQRFKLVSSSQWSRILMRNLTYLQIRDSFKDISFTSFLAVIELNPTLVELLIWADDMDDSFEVFADRTVPLPNLRRLFLGTNYSPAPKVILSAFILPGPIDIAIFYNTSGNTHLDYSGPVEDVIPADLIDHIVSTSLGIISSEPQSYDGVCLAFSNQTTVLTIELPLAGRRYSVQPLAYILALPSLQSIQELCIGVDPFVFWDSEPLRKWLSSLTSLTSLTVNSSCEWFERTVAPYELSCALINEESGMIYWPMLSTMTIHAHLEDLVSSPWWRDFEGVLSEREKRGLPLVKLRVLYRNGAQMADLPDYVGSALIQQAHINHVAFMRLPTSDREGRDFLYNKSWWSNWGDTYWTSPFFFETWGS